MRNISCISMLETTINCRRLLRLGNTTVYYDKVNFYHSVNAHFVNLALYFFLLKHKLHYCFTEFILLLLPLCIIAYFISWKLINTQKAKKSQSVTLFYYLLWAHCVDNTWHTLFRNCISQKEFCISFSQWAFLSRWEPFF